MQPNLAEGLQFGDVSLANVDSKFKNQEPISSEETEQNPQPDTNVDKSDFLPSKHRTSTTEYIGAE